MTRQRFQDRLDQLREDTLYMSEVVADRLRLGLDALETKDEDLARDVIEGDDEVNELYLELEADCVDLLALQQPVAGDLRFVVATFKIITDLERVGDLATNLGEYSLEAEREVFPEVDIQRIGEETLEMLNDAMDAYSEEDAEKCYAVSAADDDLDLLCEHASTTVVRDLISHDGTDATTDVDIDLDSEEDVDSLMSDVSRMLLTIRDLERVGDHAVNIAARTLYMVENDDSLIY